MRSTGPDAQVFFGVSFPADLHSLFALKVLATWS